MTSSKSGLFTLVFAAVLAACGPSTPNANELSTEVALAIQQTAEAASPTPAPTRTEPSTVMPTATLTAVPPTLTPEPTATPDSRVIIGDPEDYILQREDIPDVYILTAGNSTPHLNSEILAARPIEEAKAYLEASGRVGGWIIWYRRASSAVIAPDCIESYVVMFETAQGPELAMSPEWNADVLDRVKSGELEILDPIPDLGAANMVYQSRERQSSGQYFVIYTIEFRYRNIWTEIQVEGIESDIRPAYVENLARIVLARLEAAPLAEEIP